MAGTSELDWGAVVVRGQGLRRVVAGVGPISDDVALATLGAEAPVPSAVGAAPDERRGLPSMATRGRRGP
jgi:hypothetical protein